jgi:hypothetical protein
LDGLALLRLHIRCMAGIEIDDTTAGTLHRRLFLHGLPCHPAAWSAAGGGAVSGAADGADRLWIVDGTLVPVRDRNVGSSSRNYRFSANVRVIVDADTRLVPLPAWCPAPPRTRTPGGPPAWPNTAGA